MIISEIFYSLQGEGALSGIPSAFIRTAGCPLRCNWCDTPNAAAQARGKEMEVAEISALIAGYPTQHCVVTGGEPLIAYDLPELTQALREAGIHITIETSGVLPPKNILCDLASISPKLANSRPHDAAWTLRHEAMRRRPAILREWLERFPCQLKFVICDLVADLAEIDALLAEVGCEISPEKILLMPEGRTHHNATRIAQACLARGWRYCDRLHVRLNLP